MVSAGNVVGTNFHWILTYHKPDLIFSSEIVMTIVVIFIKVRITLRFSKLE